MGGGPSADIGFYLRGVGTLVSVCNVCQARYVLCAFLLLPKEYCPSQKNKYLLLSECEVETEARGVVGGLLECFV